MQQDPAGATPGFQRNRFGDAYLKEINSPAIAGQSYEELWQKRYAPLTFTADHTYIFCGTDSGLLIKAFAASDELRSLALVFVEDERYLETIAEECASELARMDNTRLLGIKELRKDVVDAHRFDHSLATGRISALPAACAEQDELGSYRGINQQIHYLMESRRWLVMNSTARLPFLQQRLLNTPEMTAPASLVKETLRGRTVVVMAAGPSLDEHIDWVKTNREKLAVICVSRIARRLQEVGITPDFVVIIDPHEIAFEVSREALALQPSPVLVFSDQAVNQLVGQWQGPKIYLGTRLPWKMEGNEIRANAPTVSNLAFSLACLTEPERIVLLGLDFCLDEAGHTHALGNMERETGVSLRTDMEEVLTYDGSVRLSSIDYYNSGKFLEKQIAERPAAITIINPSAGAMRMQGVEFLPLGSLELENDETATTIEAIRGTISTAMAESDWSRESLKQLNDFKRKLHEFKTLAQEAKKTVRLAEKAANPDKQLQKLNKIDHRIRKRFLEQRKFCVHNCGHLFTDILDTGAEANTDQSDKSLLKSRKIYSAYLDSLKILQGLLENTENMLKLHQQEDADCWSQELVDHFLSTGLPQRILQSRAQLPEGARESAESMRDAQMQLKTERLRMVLDGMQVSENSLFKTLNAAYVQHSIDKLTHYKNAIGKMLDFPHHRLYAWLAAAYLDEIIGNTDSAMQSYQAIIDQGETTLLEEALNRVAFLCIRTGDSDTALLALQVLSEINPMYIATLEQFRQVA
ncbi:MAG: motility associated factor glycosyltransferase family protein [Gammaproteobacteria bacterium]|nr:motility associated factor glycosyltransferase family protein [Gammaproteobacteria bacterium]